MVGAQAWNYSSLPNLKKSRCHIVAALLNLTSFDPLQESLQRPLRGEHLEIMAGGGCFFSGAEDCSHMGVAWKSGQAHVPALNEDVTDQVEGYYADVVRELAQVAGFTYTLRAGPVRGREEGATTYLLATGHSYDMFLYPYQDNAGRRQTGFTWPQPLSDATLRLLVPVTRPKAGLSEVMLNFLEPFEGELWCALLALAVVTAGVIWWLETSGTAAEADAEPEMQRTVVGCMKSMWLSGMSFMGQGGYTAVTAWGRLSMLSFSLLILIVVTSYTANLANFLIVKDRHVVKRSGWEDAAFRRSTICASVKTATGEFLQDYAGGRLRLVGPASGDAAVREQLLRQDCDGYAVTPHKWDQLKRSEAFNAGCMFQTVGDGVKPGHSGAPMSVYGECQYIAIQGVAGALRELADRGKLDELRQKAIDRKATMQESCLPGGGGGGTTGSRATPLGIPEMMGIIIIHGAFLAISVLGCVVYKVVRRVLAARSASASGGPAQTDTAPSPPGDVAAGTERIFHKRAAWADDNKKPGREKAILPSV